MKKLYIVRHADAVPNTTGIGDFVRSLSAQGKCDAQEAGNKLRTNAISASLMICSPAARTLTTCTILGYALGYGIEKIQTAASLYRANVHDWLSLIGQLDNRHTTVMIVGHNPGCTDTVNTLLNTHFTALPTCSIVPAELHIKSWSRIKPGCGQLGTSNTLTGINLHG